MCPKESRVEPMPISSYDTFFGAALGPDAAGREHPAVRHGPHRAGAEHSFHSGAAGGHGDGVTKLENI